MKLNDLLNTRDIPELDDSNYIDHEYRLYRYFLDKLTNDKISLKIVFGEKFKNVISLYKNKNLIENIKKNIEKHNEENKLKGKVEEIKIDIESFKQDSLPLQFFIPNSSRINLISKRAQRKISLREIIYELFPLYNDDVIRFNLKHKNKIISSGTGTFDQLSVKFEELMKIEPSSGSMPTMIELELSLESSSDNRRRHEESSNIFETNKEKEYLLSKEAILNLFKDKSLTIEQIKERCLLFNIKSDNLNESNYLDIIDQNLNDFNLNDKKLVDLRSFHKRFRLFESNEDLLKFKGRYDLELEKMKNWLNKDNMEN